MSASEYRCHQAPALSYANVTQSECFPKKDQAIVIDAIDEIPIKEYITAIGSIVKPNNIRYASRISNNRICIFLADKRFVDSLIDNNTKVNIRDNSLSIRPLITRAKRIILSNVCPIIPHQKIIDSLNELKITTVSPVTSIRAGMNEPGYTHILSFRRQVYIQPDENTKIPENFKVHFEGTNYWVYTSTDNPMCFICKKEGHLAKQCQSPVHTVKEVEMNVNQDTGGDSIQPGRVGIKRALTTGDSSTQESVSEGGNFPPNNEVDKNRKEKKSKEPSSRPSKGKKAKVLPPDLEPKKIKELEEACLPVRDIMDSDTNPYVLDYTQLKEFLYKAAGNKEF